jgi:SAM-dependent methyltransferase
MTRPPCRLCGSGNQRLLYKKKRYDGVRPELNVVITSDIYGSYEDIVLCGDCGFAYQDPAPGERDLKSAYSVLRDDRYFEEDDCRSMNAHLSLRTIRRHRSGGALLDVGSSTGIFLNAARISFDVHGVEPSVWAAGFARDSLNLKTVINDTFENSVLPEAGFDVVSLIDVIEHVADPRKTLQKACRLLKPGGLLYLVTPDIRSLSASLLGRYWWGLREAHLSYFSERTITRLLEDLGFSVVEKRSYGRIFSYAYWLSRIRKYPALFYNTADLLGKVLDIGNKVIYINTRDSIEVCAIKK